MNKRILTITLWANLTTAATAQVSIAPYYGGRRAAVSYTFDDGLQDQYTLAWPQLKKRGLKATFAVIASKMGDKMHSSQDRKEGIDGTPCMSWNMLREMAADGQEISNHGYAHHAVTRLQGEELRCEVQRADTMIFEQTGCFPRTYFYPGNAKSPETTAFCERDRVGSRTFQVSIGSKRDSTWLNRWADSLIVRGEWGVGMTHGIAVGYDHFADPQQLWSHFDYVARMQAKLWIATFHDVAAYTKERDAVKMDIRRHGSQISITPVCPLDSSLFTHPLTIEYHGAARLQSARQGKHFLEIYENQGHQLFDINPHGGIITLQTRGKNEVELPTMGWSSWNTYRVNISDSLIMRQADAMAEKGLKDAGYKYVNIDDGYFGGRDRTTGRLLVHPIRFPKGLRPVVDHIHRLGLKAGIYSDAGRNTCGSIYDADTIGVGVGLYGYDDQDCDMFFRELGFDFIKVDYCGGTPHERGDTLLLDEQTRYTEIAEAIRQTGRSDVRMNVCRWDYPGTWVSSIASSWRMSRDIRAKWSSVKNIIKENLYLSAYASSGHYNDMDMLEVGRGMKPEEDYTHFAVWCMMSSPLLIGCDLTKIKDETLKLLTDKQLIAINQDPLGLQAYVAKRQGGCYVLVKDIKRLGGNERAVAFVNLSDQEQTMTINYADIDLKGGRKAITLPAHGTHFFIAKGYRLQRRLYEAETAFLSSYQEIKNNEAFLTAIYEEDSLCSGGMKASWLGGREDNDLIWRNVNVKKKGHYALRLNCMTDEPRTIYVDVNGQTIGLLAYTGNGEQVILTELREGSNEVRLWNKVGRMPDVDYMIVDNAN